MRIRRLLMPILTIAGLATGVRVLIWASADPIGAVRAGTATFDEAVAAAAGLGAWLLVGWVCTVLALTTLTLVPGACGRGAALVGSLIGPGSAQRIARLALGLALASGPAVLAGGPAFAAHSEVAAADCAETGPTGLPLIERPTRPDQRPVPVAEVPVVNQPDQADGPDQPGQPDERIVVREGDSLWTIAADHLGPEATTSRIAAEWPRWYQANREVIGDDPDLITPGLALQSPAS